MGLWFRIVGLWFRVGVVGICLSVQGSGFRVVGKVIVFSIWVQVSGFR